MRNEDRIIRMKILKKFHRRTYDGVLKPSIVLKMTGCFLEFQKLAVFMCLENNFYRKCLGKTLPISVKLYH